jgi:hypothetical protein
MKEGAVRNLKCVRYAMLHTYNVVILLRATAFQNN